jgi:hypothetical protein
MTAEDTVTIAGLLLVGILAVLIGVLIRRGRLKPKTWPFCWELAGV